ncbi:MAG: histidinol-phosphatase [candidate division Zixibacteria bacterium]|nr:histidinol-phosphatase [candidate division Zixibacteria bacterium]
MLHGNNLALADYHIHPDFSIDARGSIDDYCRAAIDKGLAEICFTTHYDSNPKAPQSDGMIRIDGTKVPLSFEAIGRYADAVAGASEKYSPEGLEVQCGIEVGYYPGCEELIVELFNKFPFHYKLGAIHDIGDICLCCEHLFKNCFSRLSLEDMADKYFGLVAKAVNSGLFDAIAHLDVYKKYGMRYYGDAILTIHRGRVEPILTLMAANGVGVELNTSALRKGHSEYYPSMEIVNLARNAGVHIAALGSDAHTPADVGFDFDSAATIAYELFPYCDE